MVELTSIAPATREVPLLHPKTEEPVGLTFLLRPTDSKEVRAAERKWQNARLQKRGNKLSAEALENLKLEVIMAAVEGWRFESPDLTLFGEQPEYSPRTLRKLLTSDETYWIRRFLDTELGDAGAFFEDSVD